VEERGFEADEAGDVDLPFEASEAERVGEVVGVATRRRLKRRGTLRWGSRPPRR
jgi:hypothetical protein